MRTSGRLCDACKQAVAEDTPDVGLQQGLQQGVQLEHNAGSKGAWGFAAATDCGILHSLHKNAIIKNSVFLLITLQMFSIRHLVFMNTCKVQGPKLEIGLCGMVHVYRSWCCCRRMRAHGSQPDQPVIGWRHGHTCISGKCRVLPQRGSPQRHTRPHAICCRQMTCL